MWMLALVTCLAGCAPVAAPAGSEPVAPLVISAIPDQDPEKLNRLYKPVTDYAASVTGFKVGDLDLVWYGGLTGVQARLQLPGAMAIAQRDIDETFTTVFIANKASGITDLAGLKGHTFTFGSESSTSGRLMPQYFLQENGVSLSDLAGEPGFSGSHDKTIELVMAGAYDAGALNAQVWKSRVAEGKVDLNLVDLFYTTPAYYDYHWVLSPGAVERFGADFPDRVLAALMALDPAVESEKAILDLFGAQKFIPTANENYAAIEAIGREIGLIVE
jgi:phosphonate transport system substrate-binding protein